MNRFPWNQEKLMLMGFGEIMVRGLFQKNNSTLLWSVSGPEDLKVHASLYKSFANFEVAGAVVAFGVKHSPEFVLKTLGDGCKCWNVFVGLAVTLEEELSSVLSRVAEEEKERSL
ncbi:hypothetical protein Tco_1545985 [Tanacetum coccineum]